MRLILFFCFSLFASDHFEGIWEDCEGRKPFFMSFFLPFNPVVLTHQISDHLKEQCLKTWPKATWRQTGNFCDLFWVEQADSLSVLQNHISVLQKTKVIFTLTQLYYIEQLKSILFSLGFQLAAHWYNDQKDGQAIFVKKDLFDAAMRTLSYAPLSHIPSTPSVYSLEPYFKKAANKSQLHSMREIDFIYMINLDERPEKFSLSEAQFNLYGIYPYRFSAVNGWKIPAEAFAHLGVKIFPQSAQGQFMGSIYKNVNNIPFLSNEMIQSNGDAYFILGMSRGSIGIVLSHLSVLYDAFQSQYQTIWVMEDDIEIVNDPRQISDLIRTLDKVVPDWDILFTDIDTKDKKGRRVPCRSLAARPNFCVEPLAFYLNRFYPINQEFSACGMRYGAYSMIVRRSAMKKILDHFKNYGIFIPYDMDYWLIPDLKMFTVNWDIVSTRIDAPTDNHEEGYLNSSRKN